MPSLRHFRILRHSWWIIFALIFNPFVIGVFWWLTSNQQFFFSLAGTITAIAKLLGLLGVYSLLLQFILIGRVAWIEKLIGLDKLSRVHHYNGYVALSLILLHPILMTIGYSLTTQSSLVLQFLDFWANYADVYKAVIAVVLFIGIVGISFTIVRAKLRYETWYYVHLLNYAAIFLAFGHQLKVGSSFSNKWFVYYWYALYTFAISNLVLFRFLRPLYFFARHQFRVKKIVQETSDTTSVYISGKYLAQFPIQAGQFMILRFLAQGFWLQAHPFSLSCEPNDRYLRATIKNVGDFTAAIRSLKAGTRVLIDGPNGTFTESKATKKRLLLIAGGVGITPIRSLMESLAKAGKKIILLYSNTTQQEIIFKRELDELAKRYKLAIHYILTREPDWPGEKGRIDKEKIARLVPKVVDYEVYICGPVPFMESVTQDLRALTVPKKYIHYEKFSL